MLLSRLKKLFRSWKPVPTPGWNLQFTEEMNSRLLAITESAHDMIATFDLRGKILYLNRAGYEFLGIRTLGEKNGYLERYMSVPTTLRLVAGLRIAQEQGYWQDESEWIKEDGTVLTTSQTVVAHQPEGAEEPYFSTIVRDITERKEIERQLWLAKQAADEANEAKSAFLARMSHEIRTPLNGIIGLTHLLQRTELSDIQRDYLRQITVSSNGLLHILNDLLDYSKLEADKLSIETVPFRLEEVLERLSRTFAVLLGAKPVDLMLRIAPGVPDVLYGDPSRLEQILLNLVNNAIKFTDEGFISLEISLVHAYESAAALRFAVADSGVGMSPQEQARLFKPFSQASEGANRSGGTGLGLVISSSLIQRMGGTRIQVDSRFGEGSTFSFQIPFGTQGSGSSLENPLPYRLNVLVLEDGARMRDYWLQTLAEMGCTVETAENWAAAEHKLNTETWDAWIVDMENGDMHGEETWETWKRVADAKGTAIFCSTTLRGRDMLMAMEEDLRPAGVLIKPTVPMQIRHALLALCQRTEAADSAASREPERTSLRLNGTVLVVEDNEISRTVTARLVEELGLVACEASDGTQARHVLESRPVQLVLMDLQMPGMDGLETTRAIHGDERFSSLPVIALTGEDIELWRQRCLDAGMIDLLRKPVSPENLKAVLSRWLPTAVSVPSPSDSHAAWPDTDALDIPLALHRLGGKTALYLQLLDRFRQEYADLTKQLRDYADSDDSSVPQRLLHSFRGAAAHLGAIPVAREALLLEEAYRKSQPTEEALGTLDVRLNALIDTIDSILRQKRG